MLNWFEAAPGRLYVVATLLPLAAFIVLLLGGAVRAFCRPFRTSPGILRTIYRLLGGDRPIKTGAYFATTLMALTAVLAVMGLLSYLNDPSEGTIRASRWAERIDWVRLGADVPTPAEFERIHAADPERSAPRLAQSLQVGYKIDSLSAVMFAMVAVVSTLIFVFSIGYMKDETQETLQTPNPLPQGERGDQKTPPSLLGKGAGGLGHGVGGLGQGVGGLGHGVGGLGHSAGFHRRGRFGRFFLYLSLFCFSMLNLLIADNLFQVFVSWELVGVCSFFLIGFYYERPSASRAANKAFIVNRIGDAGFLVGILIAWTYLGTLNIEEMFQRVRSPERDTHGKLEFANQIVRVNAAEADRDGASRFQLPPKGEEGKFVALFPLSWPEPDHFHGLGHARTNDSEFTVPAKADYNSFGAVPYWLFVVMGIGIFLGCVGKSAQVPLHTWLPDAMEGPTPVSALIHAATMVAAGVYLVGRVFPLFAPEVLLVIAYVGAITLFMAATIALVQTDIKRILAYSTCSQLGFMMLALGIGGWVAGLLHLITHAFFKALLFLCSGSVIHGCHHEQDIRKMGGLRRKMPITAFTMLVGVLAISGMPLLSGWYSKDQIIANVLGFGLDHKQHFLLLVLPILTTGLTAFYMFRLWFLTFAGAPRDRHVHEHAHESPLVMTLPLIVLAAFAIGVAWGWPIWEADASYLGHVLAKSEPAAVEAQFAHEHHTAHESHLAAGGLALLLALTGAGLAYWLFGRKQPTTERMYAAGGPGYRFLLNKWYFDEVYDAGVVKPTVQLAKAAAAVDKRPTDGPIPAGALEVPSKRFDFLTLDGILNALGQSVMAAGRSLRAVQTGRLRMYIVALALTAALMLGILTALAK